MSTRSVRLCACTGPIAVVVYLLAFWPIGHFIPPTAPGHGAAQVAAFYDAHRDGIRLAMVLGMPAAMLLLPFYVVVAEGIARIEDRRFPALAIISLAGNVILLVFFLVCSMLWITASFRTDLAPGTVRMLNDFGWLVFVMVWPEYTLSMLALAWAIVFKDSPDTPRGPWPRWFGFFTAWVALSGAGGSLAVFFKHGPFAWNGLVGFYMPIAIFVVWTVVCSFMLFTRGRPATGHVVPR